MPRAAPGIHRAVFRWVDHTGELELEVESPSPEAVFLEAADAVRELLASEDGDPPAGDRAHREVSLRATDRSRLLAAWLGELAFLAETEGLVPEHVSDLRLDERSLRACVHGRLGDPPHLVKAVTLHRLAFEPSSAGWRARAVLDV